MAQRTGSIATYDIASAFAQEMENLGLGTFADGTEIAPTIFAHEEPTGPDNISTVFQIGGGEANVDVIGTATIIQVRTRGGDDFSEAMTRATAIANAFRWRDGLLGPTLVAFVQATSPPESLGREPGRRTGGRWRIVQTFRVLVKA